MKGKYVNKIIIVFLILLILYILYLFTKKFKQEYMGNQKTMYLIWQNKRGVNTQGLGDKVRGAIFLKQYCDDKNINLFIDGTDDTTSDFLKNVKSEHYEKIKSKELLFLGDTETNYDKLDSAIENNDEIYVYSNTHPFRDLSLDDKVFANMLLEPVTFLSEEINDKVNKLPENYGVQHFRFPDAVFSKDFDETNKLFKDYFDLLKKSYKETDVLITNSVNFKKYAKQNLGIKTIECDNDECIVEHIGQGNTDSYNSMKNSFIDFFIVTKSKYIKTHTNYNWISSFVLWPSKIFDIPIENTNVEYKE